MRPREAQMGQLLFLLICICWPIPAYAFSRAGSNPYLSAIREVHKAPENVNVFRGFVVSAGWLNAELGHFLL